MKRLIQKILPFIIVLSGCENFNINININNPDNNTIKVSGQFNSLSTSSTIISSISSSISNSSKQEQSPIEYLLAILENVTMEVGEQLIISDYYELKGYKTLTAKQKEVTVTSSDETVVQIDSLYKTMTAIKEGTAVITVISDIDTIKTCSFTVKVTNSSPIKSLEAVSDTVEIKIGDQVTTANFYELKGYKPLSAKQKLVTITSSDENVVKIDASYKTMTAVNLGTATITVVSDADKTKSCSFTITVSDCFFDRTITSINSSWDVDHEMDAENPYIKVDTNISDGIYIRNSDGLKWYVETEITIHSVLSGEEWPKFGLIANTTTNTEINNNKLCYYLNAPMNEFAQGWKNFGVCEVSNDWNWAWNAGVGNNEARYIDVVTSVESPITYETKFHIGMVREGFNFHLFANKQYICSIQTLGTLFGLYNAETLYYTDPAPAIAGFFAFNSVITFSNYRFVSESAEVDTYIPAEPVFNLGWAA